MIIIAIITAALTPIITKRLSATSTVKNRISTNCDSYYPEGYCSMCYITPKRCIICTKTCRSDEYKNVSDCICEPCKENIMTRIVLSVIRNIVRNAKTDIILMMIINTLLALKDITVIKAIIRP